MKEVIFIGLVDEPGYDDYLFHLVKEHFLARRTQYITCSSSQELLKVDRLLWTYEQESFLPHDIEDDQDKPIDKRIVLSTNSAVDSYQIGIILGDPEIGLLTAFELVYELIPLWQESRRTAKRERYKQMKELGYQVRYLDYK